MNIKAKTGGNNGAKPGDNLSEIIGKNISRLRNKLNMSQEDLSNRLFVSKDLVSKWETGARRPDWNHKIEATVVEVCGNAGYNWFDLPA